MVDWINYWGCTPLMVACQEGHTDFAVEIVSKGQVSMILTDSQGFSAIHIAAANNNLNTVEALVDHGCHMDQVGD